MLHIVFPALHKFSSKTSKARFILKVTYFILLSERKRKISECSNMTDEDDGIGSFTSTVCVNFSEDDLRLATIPGQVKVKNIFYLLRFNPTQYINKWQGLVCDA